MLYQKQNFYSSSFTAVVITYIYTCKQNEEEKHRTSHTTCVSHEYLKVNHETYSS